MRPLVPWVGCVIVLVALWPTTCTSAEGGPTECRSAVLPLPWGEGSDTWGIAMALIAAAVTWVVVRWLVSNHR